MKKVLSLLSVLVFMVVMAITTSGCSVNSINTTIGAVCAIIDVFADEDIPVYSGKVEGVIMGTDSTMIIFKNGNAYTIDKYVNISPGDYVEVYEDDVGGVYTIKHKYFK